MTDNTQVYYKRIKRLEEIKALDPIAFERYAGTLFEWMGWTVQTTPITGDKGVDLLLCKQNRTAVVQCKRYEGTVSASIVRDLYGVMVHNMVDEAYLVTTGTISLPAQQWASGKPIHLVDGNTLIEWANSFDHEKEEAKRREEQAKQREEQAQRAVEARRKRTELFKRIKTTLMSSGGVIVLLIIPACCGLVIVCAAISYALRPIQAAAPLAPVATPRPVQPQSTAMRLPTATQPASVTPVPPSPIPAATQAPTRPATIQVAASATRSPATTMAPSATSLPTVSIVPTVVPVSVQIQSSPTNTPWPTPTTAPTWTPRPTSTPWPTSMTEPTWTPWPTSTTWPTWTPRPTSTPWPTETPWSTSATAPSLPLSIECPCDRGNVLNCPDFTSQAQAQTCYLKCGGLGHDIHDLDRDEDGTACEDTQWP